MEPYLGEIRLMGFVKDMYGWLPCDGRLLQIAQNQALYALLGIRYGGDGKATFGIPDLRGRTPMFFYGACVVGTMGGAETVALSTVTVPPHMHGYIGSSENADKPGVGTNSNRLLAASTTNLYGAPANTVAMDDSTSSSGGAQSHSNMQPSLVAAYYIATTGLYPSRQ